jgi:predicted transcriptional regulator
MTIHKEEVLELVRQLPDEIDIEELIYRLYLLEKLAAAEADIAAGRTLSAEEVRKRVREWQQ